MRELLFRGKSVTNGDWVKGDLILHTNGCAPFIITTSYMEDDSSVSFDYEFVNKETVGQYTGLKDKNGTKIFEGDILTGECLDCEVLVARFGEYNQADKIEDTHIGFFAEFHNEAVPGMFRKDLGWWAVKCEVIGNIHNNHELLEDNND